MHMLWGCVFLMLLTILNQFIERIVNHNLLKVYRKNLKEKQIEEEKKDNEVIQSSPPAFGLLNSLIPGENKDQTADERARVDFDKILNEFSGHEAIIKKIILDKYTEVEGYGTLLYDVDVTSQKDIYKRLNKEEELISKKMDLNESGVEFANETEMFNSLDTYSELDQDENIDSVMTELQENLSTQGDIKSKGSDTIEIDIKPNQDDTNTKVEVTVDVDLLEDHQSAGSDEKLEPKVEIVAEIDIKVDDENK